MIGGTLIPYFRFLHLPQCLYVVVHRVVKHILLKKLLQNANGLFSMPVNKIIYAYSEHQPMFDEMEQTIPNLSLHQGLPSKEDIEQYTEGVNHTIVTFG